MFRTQFIFLVSIRWSLAINFFFECFVPNIRLLLKTHTYEVVDLTVLTYFTSNLDYDTSIYKYVLYTIIII